MNKASILLVLLVSNLLSHLPFLSLPPCGAHVWRQCNTLAMSRNFERESMNILEPRIDRRNETTGITGSHFPLYEWGLAACTKILGDHYIVPRLYSLILFSIGLLAFYLLLLEIGYNWKICLLGTFILGNVPQLYYDGINAMPDIEALGLAMWSIYLYKVHARIPRSSTLILASMTGLLAGLIKIQFLLLPYSFFFVSRIHEKTFRNRLLSLAFITPIILVWYWHAKKLTELNNLKEYGLWIKSISTERKVETIIKNLMSDLPEMLLGWPLLMGILWLLIRNFRQLKVNYTHLPYLIWLFGFIIFYFVAIERMFDHSYYFIPILPLGVLGLMYLYKQSKSGIGFLVLICILNFSWSLARIIPSRWVPGHYQISETFADKTRLDSLKSRIPPSSIYVVGPDISGCIYFYFLDVKGYSFEFPEELLEVKGDGNALDEMRRQGARYLICTDRERVEPILKKAGKSSLHEDFGEFSIWSLE